MTKINKPSEPRSSQEIDGGMFERVFQNGPMIQLIINLDQGQIVDGNAAATAFYGWSREKLRSMNIHEINTLPKEELNSILAKMHRALGQTFQFRHRLASGETREVESSITAMDGGSPMCLAIIRDITSRKQNEESLLLAQRAMDASTNGLTIADARQPDLPFIYANPAFAKMTGYSLEEIQGHNCRFLQGTDRNQPEITLLREAIKHGQSCEVVLRNYRKDGTLFWNEVLISPVHDPSGAITHFIGTQKDISDRKKAESEIERLAYFDSLTELPNRKLFMDRLTVNLAFCQRTKTCSAIVIIDLDHFKLLNEAEGHDIGDQLLKEMSHRLNTCFREGDTGARMGGDEFAVLLPNLAANSDTAAQIVQGIMERVLTCLRQPVTLGSSKHQTTVSIGVIIYPQGNDSPASLLQQADTAMYRAKSSGRNAVCYFEPAMQAVAQARLTVERNLRTALEKNELRIFLQPQVNENATIIGAEALMRWQRPEEGLVSPAAFIPIAEETGLIVPMGEWIFTQACQLAKQLENNGVNIRIAVNVSPRQFRDPHFLSHINTTLQETGANPRRLALEVTEAVIFDNVNDAVTKLTQLKDMGFHLSLDDFGTGYSSLAHLQKLPLSEIKIDRSFVKDAPSNPQDAALVEAILAVARPKNLQVVAEGVETQEHVDFLKHRGCPLFQGYFYGRPVPAEQFMAIVQKPGAIPGQ